MRCSLYRFVLSLFLLVAPLATAAAEMKLVPIVSRFLHADHHWYIWLRGDAVYEAVEITWRDRGPATPPLVWVFFTERDGPKRQVHYFNDARIAAARRGHFRDIAYRMTGTEGGPRGVSVELVDEQKRPVAIDVKFAPGAQLVTMGAGLTGQIGHAMDRHLLVFFRERNAFAKNWQVMVAGVDVAQPQPGQNHPAPRPAAYSSGIFIATFPFADRRITFDPGSPADGVARFVPVPSTGNFVADLVDGTKLELATDADGRVQHYRHRDRSHVLELGFAPPLPSPDRLLPDFASTFRIAIDGHRDLVVGTVRATRRDKVVVLDWLFDTPDWMRVRPLRTTVTLETSTTATIALRPAAR